MDYDVKTVTIKNEDQLFSIPDFTEELLRTDPSIREAGVFKVLLPPALRSEGTPLQKLLSLTDDRLSVAEKQKVVRFNNCPNLYGHRSAGAKVDNKFCTSGEVRDFVLTVKDPSNFNFESCCSTILNNDGPECLVDHFFNKVVKCEMASSATEIVKKKKKLSAVKAQGKRDATSLKTFVKRLNALTPQDRLLKIEKDLLTKKKPTMGDCECDGCIIDTAVFEQPQQHVMYGKGVEVTVADSIKMTKNFGLFCLSSTSILRLLKQDFPGISLPYLYYGTTHSFFPAHIEDFSLFSWNFLHFGKPKIWIVVPPPFAFKLTQCIMDQAPNMFHSSCSNLLGHKYFFPSPQWLQDMDIPFKIVVQREGESVVVCPNAVHFGWNGGISVAEACNFATASWLPYAIVAPKCSCLESAVHMDLEKIIAAVRPDLLESFIKNSIPEGEDEFFYKSILRANQMNIICHKKDDKQIPEPEMEESDGDESPDSDVYPVLPNKREGSTGVTCPSKLCSQRYIFRNRQKIEQHIITNHGTQKDIDQIWADFHELFPERNKVTKKECNLCGKMIAGRGAQMKRHQETKSCTRNGQ